MRPLSPSSLLTAKPLPRPGATKPEAQPSQRPAATKPETKPSQRPAATKLEPQPSRRPAAVVPPVDPKCLARVRVTGMRCFLDRHGPSRWCPIHQAFWKNKDSPAWDLRPGTTVPGVDPIYCPAWVCETGLKCNKTRWAPSRYCAEHYPKWTGKQSPVWRPCP